ncbi:hypothetical protein NOCARDAX2BIS_160052 [Nocardioides sp. AX2bis]|nr:hypothetical protein NOCARDAX2BIS_160052 [Nocardioides sp. AX2bis]
MGIRRLGDPCPLLLSHQDRELPTITAKNVDAAVVALDHLTVQCQALEQPLPPRCDFLRALGRRRAGRRGHDLTCRGGDLLSKQVGVVIHELPAAEVSPFTIDWHVSRPAHGFVPYFEPCLGAEPAATPIEANLDDLDVVADQGWKQSGRRGQKLSVIHGPSLSSLVRGRTDRDCSIAVDQHPDLGVMCA